MARLRARRDRVGERPIPSPMARPKTRATAPPGGSPPGADRPPRPRNCPTRQARRTRPGCLSDSPRQRPAEVVARRPAERPSRRPGEPQVDDADHRPTRDETAGVAAPEPGPGRADTRPRPPAPRSGWRPSRPPASAPPPPGPRAAPAHAPARGPGKAGRGPPRGSPAPPPRARAARTTPPRGPSAAFRGATRPAGRGGRSTRGPDSGSTRRSGWLPGAGRARPSPPARSSPARSAATAPSPASSRAAARRDGPARRPSRPGPRPAATTAGEAHDSQADIAGQAVAGSSTPCPISTVADAPGSQPIRGPSARIPSRRLGPRSHGARTQIGSDRSLGRTPALTSTTCATIGDSASNPPRANQGCPANRSTTLRPAPLHQAAPPISTTTPIAPTITPHRGDSPPIAKTNGEPPCPLRKSTWQHAASATSHAPAPTAQTAGAQGESTQPPSLRSRRRSAPWRPNVQSRASVR